MSGLFVAGSYIAILPTTTSSGSTTETQGASPWTAPTNVRTLNATNTTAATTANRNMILTLGGLSGIPSGATIISITITGYWYLTTSTLSGLGDLSAVLRKTSGTTIATLYCFNGVDAGIISTDVNGFSGSGLTGADLSGATVNLILNGGGVGESASAAVDYIQVDVVWA